MTMAYFSTSTSRSGLLALTILLNEKSTRESLAVDGNTSSTSHVCILVSSRSLMRAMSVEGSMVGSKRRVRVTVDSVVRMNSSTEDSARVERTEVDKSVLERVRDVPWVTAARTAVVAGGIERNAVGVKVRNRQGFEGRAIGGWASGRVKRGVAWSDEGCG